MDEQSLTSWIPASIAWYPKVGFQGIKCSTYDKSVIDWFYHDRNQNYITSCQSITAAKQLKKIILQIGSKCIHYSSLQLPTWNQQHRWPWKDDESLLII